MNKLINLAKNPAKLQATYDYKDINQVLRGIRTQIMDSVQYCYDHFPVFSNPKQLFNYLKTRTTFVHDPEGIELLQSVPTLFENNYHNTPGAGDCDCFTVLSCAAFIAQGWGNFDIVLTGRNKRTPVHIYTYINFNGIRYAFDLTEPYFNSERNYPFKQILPIKFYKI